MDTKKRVIIAVIILTCCVVGSAAPHGGSQNPSPPKPMPKPMPVPMPMPGATFSTRPTLKTATVEISNFQFTPKNVTVKVGGTVTWQNKEGSHTVTADKGSFSSPTLTAGKSFSRKFTKKGTYRYYCSFHGGAGGSSMSGTVTVVR